MVLFKKKSTIKYLREQNDKLREEYKKLEDKFEGAIKQHMNDRYDYNQTKKAINEKRELILQLQNKIYALQEELIAKNKIIQGMDK